MKTQPSLESRVDRREFTLAAMLAVLGGVSITISACGKSANPSMPSAAPPLADNSGAIAANHGHVAVVTGAQLTAANTLVLNLQGTASHNHTLELSAGEIAQIRDGQTVARTCSPTTHMHMVTFN